MHHTFSLVKLIFHILTFSPVGYHCRSSSSDYTPALDKSASGHEEKSRNVGDSRDCLFSDASNLRSEVFYEAEEDFPVPQGEKV